ncbi:MAG: arginine deiminase-related protein [Nitrospinaceae bacterium]
MTEPIEKHGLCFHALVREPGPSIIHALSRHPQKDSIDFARAVNQHRAYVQALKRAGGNIVALPPLEAFPDSVFVEDTAVVFDQYAIACPVKEKSRKGEVESVVNAIREYRPLRSIEPPAALDGGDVLDTGERVFAGLSQRTNKEGIDALSRLAGKPVTPISVLKGLHLKSGVGFLGRNILVADPESVDPSLFKGFQIVEAAAEESYAANCLALGNTVLMATGYPKLKAKIEGHGFKTIELEMSEFEKADGGITCLSLIVPSRSL